MYYNIMKVVSIDKHCWTKHMNKTYHNPVLFYTVIQNPVDKSHRLYGKGTYKQIIIDVNWN